MRVSKSLLLLGIVAVVSPVAVWAQPGAGTVAVPPKNEVKALPLKNVQSSIIAYWLDPVHNAKPLVMLSPDEMNKGDMRTEDEKAADLANLAARFPGLQAITPLLAQNSLIVLGTAEAIAKVTEEVAKLDKRLQTVNVEVSMVQIDPKDLGQLGLNYTAPEADKVPANAIAGIGKSDAVRRGLQALTAAGKAKIVASLNAVVVDQVGAPLGIMSSLPATIGVRGADGEFRELKAQGEKGGTMTIEMESTLYVLPKLETDGTVTLKLQPSRRLWLADGGRSIDLRVLKNREVVISAKNGDTVAVNGVTLGGSIEDAMAGLDAQHTVMLVTPRFYVKVGESKGF